MPFEPWHLKWLRVQDTQANVTVSEHYGVTLKAAGPAFSAFVGMDVIACAGVVEFWPGRAQVWSLLSDQMPTYRKAIHKAVKNFLKDYRCRRLECVIDPHSRAALTWAARLGFSHESYMRAYTPDGNVQAMMVRIEA